jgi:hypothetical protein
MIGRPIVSRWLPIKNLTHGRTGHRAKSNSGSRPQGPGNLPLTTNH